MRFNAKVKLINLLWCLFLVTVALYSCASYWGLSWLPTEYARVVSMVPKSIMSYTAIAAFLLTSAFLTQMRRLRVRNKVVCLSGLLLLCLGILWLIPVIFKGTSLLLINSTPIVLIELGMIMVLVCNLDVAEFLRKACPFFACGYTLLAIIEAIKFLIAYPLMRMDNGPVIAYFVNAWITVAVWWCNTFNQPKKNFKIYICCVLLLIVSIITTSRSWMIQAIVLLLGVFFMTTEKSTKKMIGRLILSGSFLAIVCWFLVNNLGGPIEYIISRFSQDTRTNQLKSFFAQVNVLNLLVGGGMNAKYIWNGKPYNYIDNQFLFWMFRYGILSLVGYWGPFVYAFVCKSKKENFNKLKPYYLILFMWILAMGGFCIYYGIFVDIGNIYIIFAVSELIRRKKDLL